TVQRSTRSQRKATKIRQEQERTGHVTHAATLRASALDVAAMFFGGSGIRDSGLGVRDTLVLVCRLAVDLA
ncbi:MAG: hypothetical protein WD875_03650, partial [Pirellulales bacterium]